MLDVANLFTKGMRRMENTAISQTASMEDYLEAIVILEEQGKLAKVTEIGKALGVKKPSVTSALAKLSEAGLVQHKKYGDVVLTAEGERIAHGVYQRHRTLRHFLVEILNVDPVLADEDACRVEHVLSRESLERLAKFVEYALNRPQGKPKWLKGFNYYFQHSEGDGELMGGVREEMVEKTNNFLP
jgi:DtxR family Mn-dependent transcriptional regulator